MTPHDAINVRLRAAAREFEDAEYEASTSGADRWQERIAQRHRFGRVLDGPISDRQRAEQVVDTCYAIAERQRKRDQDQRDESSRMWLIGALPVAISLALILVALAVSG